MVIRLAILLAFVGGLGTAALYVFKQGKKIGELEGDLRTANERYEIAQKSLEAKTSEVEDLRKALEIFISNESLTEEEILQGMCDNGDFIDPENICNEG